MEHMKRDAAPMSLAVLAHKPWITKTHLHKSNPALKEPVSSATPSQTSILVRGFGVEHVGKSSVSAPEPNLLPATSGVQKENGLELFSRRSKSTPEDLPGMTCPVGCGRTFRLGASLDRHVKAAHMCPHKDCTGLRFMAREEIRSHKLESHGHRPFHLPYSCGMCAMGDYGDSALYSVSNFAKLQSHFATAHSAPRSFVSSDSIWRCTHIECQYPSRSGEEHGGTYCNSKRALRRHQKFLHQEPTEAMFVIEDGDTTDEDLWGERNLSDGDIYDEYMQRINVTAEKPGNIDPGKRVLNEASEPEAKRNKATEEPSPVLCVLGSDRSLTRVERGNLSLTSHYTISQDNTTGCQQRRKDLLVAVEDRKILSLKTRVKHGRVMRPV